MKLSAQERDLIESRVYAYLQETVFKQVPLTDEEEFAFMESMQDDKIYCMMVENMKLVYQIDELNGKVSKLRDAISTEIKKLNSEVFAPINNTYNVKDKLNIYLDGVKQQRGLIMVCKEKNVLKVIGEEILLADTKNKSLSEILEDVKNTMKEIYTPKNNKRKK